MASTNKKPNCTVVGDLAWNQRVNLGAEDLADIAILTALRDPECQAVLDILGNDNLRERVVRLGALYRIFDIVIASRKIRIVVATQTEMGMVPST